MAVKDTIGGWKSNAFSYKTAKACTTGMFFMGKALKPFMNGIGITNFTCPLQKVLYYYIFKIELLLKFAECLLLFFSFSGCLCRAGCRFIIYSKYLSCFQHC